MGITKTNALKGLAELYGKNLSSSAAQMIEKVLEMYTDDDVKLACEWIVRDGAERMPPPIALRRKCEEVRTWRRRNEPIGRLMCAYRDQGESIKSRTLCCEVTQEDAQVSELQGWGTLCKWHYDLRYCAHFPDSLRKRFVDSMLKENPCQQSAEPQIASSSENYHISEYAKEWLLSDVLEEPATTPQGYWF